MSSTSPPETKRTARERLAAERARQAAREHRRQRLVRALAAVAVVAVVVGSGVAWQASRAKVNKAAPRPAAVSEVGGGVPVGTVAAPVIDVYEDFQCPVCRDLERAMGPTLDQLVATGRARVVYHTLSFLGPESVRAANAFGCASDAGRAEQFHDELFANQPAEHSGGYRNDDLVRAGEKVGITGGGFGACVKDGKYDDWVAQLARAGDDAGVTSTPTLLVAGRELPRTQYTVPGLQAAVAAASKTR